MVGAIIVAALLAGSKRDLNELVCESFFQQLRCVLIFFPS
jgi:hypothetical protein